MVKLAVFNGGRGKPHGSVLPNDVSSLRKVSQADSHRFETFHVATSRMRANRRFSARQHAPRHGKPCTHHISNRERRTFSHPARPERIHPTVGVCFPSNHTTGPGDVNRSCFTARASTASPHVRNPPYTTIRKKEISPMAYELAPLPYDYAALEPFIDAETMHLHHDKHHQTYINNVNAALEKHREPGFQAGRRSAPRSECGARGHSHRGAQQCWRPLQPHHVLEHHGPCQYSGIGGAPTGPIADQIKADFGDFDAFKKTFNETTAKQFGSGWGWLVLQGGKLKVITTPNQDSPLSQGLYPILGNDVWEHAYYLKYQNRRPDYLAAWWNVVNWAEVNKRFEKARSKRRSRCEPLAEGPDPFDAFCEWMGKQSPTIVFARPAAVWFGPARRSESACALCWEHGNYAERKLVLEPAKFFEGRRHIRGGYGLSGDSRCSDTGRASACCACGYTAGYTLSQALNHHAVFAAEARLCRAGRVRRRRGHAGDGLQSEPERQRDRSDSGYCAQRWRSHCQH